MKFLSSAKINGSQYMGKFQAIGEGKGGIFKGRYHAEMQMIISCGDENQDFAFSTLSLYLSSLN
jgi:hypothetical protein